MATFALVAIALATCGPRVKPAAAAWTAAPPAARPVVALDGRRAVLAAALSLALAPRPARAASFAERADASLERIRGAETGAELAQALTQLGDLADEYGGLADRQAEVVQKLRTIKSSALWSEQVDIAYRDTMRSIDPFRVVAVRPALQATVYAYGPVYVALLVVQQVLPKFFAPAYAGAALLLFGPIAFALVNS
ncbi:hypothetical protein KFE25_002673 [Diacronema lutheri]|uniref:Uncharacterized protein n=1 Tax=Diacronema lutheri TaxID=2081491 RepID=A0A8J6CBS0_DIALT|nr:hypothetical protein KFE25_002673 [Diacronema lutheri]